MNQECGQGQIGKGSLRGSIVINDDRTIRIFHEYDFVIIFRKSTLDP